MPRLRKIVICVVACLLLLLVCEFIGIKLSAAPPIQKNAAAPPIQKNALYGSRPSFNECTNLSELGLLSVPHTAYGIPFVIHQIYKTVEVPIQYEGFIRQCRAINSRFVHLLWTDEDFNRFLNLHHPKLRKLLRHYTVGIQKSDFMRYVLLYHFGGVYIDMDVECIKPFDVALDQFKAGCVLDSELPLQTQLLYEKSSIVVMNSAMMARRHHPFLKFLIDRLHLGLTESLVSERTGPGFLTLRYKEYSLQKRPKADEVVVPDSSFFSPLVDAGQFSNIDRKCAAITSSSSRILRHACEQWPRVRDNVDKQREIAERDAILIHRFLHLGYVWSGAQLKTFRNVCQTIPGLSRLRW